MKRTAALLTVYEKEGKKIVDALKNNLVTPADAKSLLTEMLRAELARLLVEGNTLDEASDYAVDDRIAALEAENKSLRRAARKREWTAVQALLQKASELVAIPLPDPLSPDLGSQAMTLKRHLNDVEVQVLEGDDLRHASGDPRTFHGAGDLDTFVQAPVLISQAWAQTLKTYPTLSMKGNIDALARVALEFFGDVPVSSITKERQKAFFAWMARLPKMQGKGHGKNRFKSEATVVLKHDEIEAADAADFVVTEEIRKRTDISNAEKRAILAEKLTPRLTISTLKNKRNALNRMLVSAQDLGAPKIAMLTYKDVERIVVAQAPEDQLYVRVTKPKLRMPWSEERLSAFLTSPIYTGCSSPHRRWKRGKQILRDATYWVPLIVLTLGTRIEEILLLKRTDVRMRNGCYCFAIASGSENTGKTEDARRVIPLPQLLLDLGFIEWFHALPDAHGVMLFLEAVNRSEKGDVAGAFGKHFRRILERLDLRDFDEDFYAMRKTFSSMLRSADVADGQRQAIAGHKHGSVLNIHYTAHHTRDLKDAVDKADFGINIGRTRLFGFPVILSSRQAQTEILEVEVTLSDRDEAATVTVKDLKSDKPVFDYSREDCQTTEQRHRKAKTLRELLASHSLRLPTNSAKRAAFEHFQALA
ncbi:MULTISPECIES: site-specific integrase [unclassified Marinovum]